MLLSSSSSTVAAGVGIGVRGGASPCPQIVSLPLSSKSWKSTSNNDIIGRSNNNNNKRVVRLINNHRQNAVTEFGMAAAAAASDLATSPAPTTTTAAADIPWQIVVGSLAGVTPFIVAGIEFSKRIIAQRECEICGGSGLLLKNDLYIRCPSCGGFLPWQSWKRFFTG